MWFHELACHCPEFRQAQTLQIIFHSLRDSVEDRPLSRTDSAPLFSGAVSCVQGGFEVGIVRARDAAEYFAIYRRMIIEIARAIGGTQAPPMKFRIQSGRVSLLRVLLLRGVQTLDIDLRSATSHSGCQRFREPLSGPKSPCRMKFAGSAAPGGSLLACVISRIRGQFTQLVGSAAGKSLVRLVCPER